MDEDQLMCLWEITILPSNTQFKNAYQTIESYAFRYPEKIWWVGSC